jgi:dihydroorotate dehydrogenase (fumarate)
MEKRPPKKRNKIGGYEMVDLTTTYLGLELKNPVVASASPLSHKVETAQELQKAGVAALVMHSLFEEQIISEGLKIHADLLRGTEEYAEAISYIPEVGVYSIGPDSYLKQVERLKKAVSIPVIGSLNGITPGGWVEYAQKIQDAGADALELNIYDISTDLKVSSSELEDRYLTLIQDIRKTVKIPLAVKLSPFFTSLPNFASRLAGSGVNGVVFFNRFYQPDFDLEALEVIPNLVLSNSDELRLPLRWIAILYGRVNLDFALTSGVHTSEDVLKAMMAGAKVAMIASEFLKNGINQAAKILAGMTSWLEEREYTSIKQLQGSMSQKAIAQPVAFERANYMRVLSSY